MPPKRKLPTVHAGEPMTSVRALGKRSKNAVSPPVERTRPLFTSMPMTSSPHPTTKSTSLLALLRDLGVDVRDAHLSECLQNGG